MFSTLYEKNWDNKKNMYGDPKKNPKQYFVRAYTIFAGTPNHHPLKIYVVNIDAVCVCL